MAQIPNLSVFAGGQMHHFRYGIDPNKVLNHFGRGTGNCFETNYLYPRVAYRASQFPQVFPFEQHAAQANGVIMNYSRMENRVRQHNWTGSGPNAVRGTLRSRHEFRVMCATVYEKIKWTTAGGFNRAYTIHEPGEHQNRVIQFGVQPLRHNFLGCVQVARGVLHFTYVIDIQGVMNQVNGLTVNQRVQPGGPLKLLTLDDIQAAVLHNVNNINGARHVCFNVILRIHRITNLKHRAEIAEAIQEQFWSFANAIPAGIVRAVNIWEAFGNNAGRRAQSCAVYRGDRRIVLNNPGRNVNNAANGGWPTRNQHPPIVPVDYTGRCAGNGAIARYQRFWKCHHGTDALGGVTLVRDKTKDCNALHNHQSQNPLGCGFICAPGVPVGQNGQGQPAPTPSLTLINRNNNGVAYHYPR